VGITYNLKRHIVTDPPDAEAEFDDMGTILAVKGAIEEKGYEAELFESDQTLPVRLARQRPDIVFNIAEGTNGRGREAHVPAILSYLGIPYTGSDEVTMCVTMDKSLTVKLLGLYNIPAPKHILLKAKNYQAGSAANLTPDIWCGAAAGITADLTPGASGPLSFPVIVKPNAEGSGKGISGVSVAANTDELHNILPKMFTAYKQDMLVEEYIAGREFTVGIIGDGRRARVFTPMEIIFRDNSAGIYSYEVKRNFKDYVDYKCPPDISADKQAELMDTAGKIYDILECRDFARMDFRMDAQDNIYFIEINTLPGLAPGYSDYPMLAEYNGIGYNDLVQRILANAMIRYGL